MVIKMKERHGGDIYRNRVKIDFSVNVNPLGMPDAVKKALQEAIEKSEKYPDMLSEELKSSVSEMLSVPEEYLLFGNGASELFMAIVHAIKPAKVVIPVPSFYGYEYVAEAAGAEVIYYMLAKEKSFLPKEEFFEVLTEDVDMVFLANPNNPTGALLDKEYLRRLLNLCREKGILVVLDECFIEFCGDEFSMREEVENYENLLLVRAFTKIFAIPGVRLGYLIGSSIELLNRIRRQLPEWNISTFAQEAGCACAKQISFMKETVGYVNAERQFLAEGLRKLGLKVFPAEANFMLVSSEKDLYESLLKQEILIRDCENFKGLGKGYYRIAVRGRADNEALLRAIGEIS